MFLIKFSTRFIVLEKNRIVTVQLVLVTRIGLNDHHSARSVNRNA